MKFWALLFLCVVTAAATAAIILVETDVWAEPPDLLVPAAAVGLGLVAGYEFLSAALRAKGETRAQKIDKAGRTALMAAFDSIQRLTGIEHGKLGFNCFLVPTWFRKVLPRRLRKILVALIPSGVRSRVWRGPVLRRLEPPVRFTVQTESAVDWKYGKGVIGLCWQRRSDVSMDLFKKYAPWLDCDKQTWENQVPPDVKIGLTYDEFCRIGGKYGAVVAAPILKDSEFYGCVVLDVPWEDLYSKVWTHAVRAELGNAAEYIKDHLP